jgi:anaerobic magnesium-protoporphyrin IX monomethyl ester cyclase
MILLVNPRVVSRPQNRRFPLSLMALGAALPEDVTWEIVDGNRPQVDAFREVCGMVDARAGGPDPVRLLAISVMPGPQLVEAVPLTKRLKERYPAIPIVWGGNFPGLYPRPVLNAPYVDYVVRGQGEQTLNELLEVIDGHRDPSTVAGLSFRGENGPAIGRERPWLGPNELPPPPYHRIDVADYLHPTMLGRRTGVYQASIGCPYSCSFCGVISVFGSKEKQQSPERTVEHLSFLTRTYGMDGLHFYDNNFFMTEAHAVEIAERMKPLGLRWWCEARIDAVLRFSDRTWKLLRESGWTMVFFGAESGSNEVLKKMNKRLTVEETMEAAARSRQHGVIPEFSFVLGDPQEPAREVENTLAFVRKLKQINPDCELITYFYTPTPQRGDTYGGVDPISGTPSRLEDWTTPEWVGWMTHEDPHVPWMTAELRAKVLDFETVLKSRFPSVHDTRTRGWGKAVARLLAAPRWASERYEDPRLLRRVRKWARLPEEDRQAYGHLRPA